MIPLELTIQKLQNISDKKNLDYEGFDFVTHVSTGKGTVRQTTDT